METQTVGRRQARRSVWDTPRVFPISRDTFRPWMAQCLYCEACGRLLAIGEECAEGHATVPVRCEPSEEELDNE